MSAWDDVTIEETTFLTFDRVGTEFIGTVTKLDTKVWPAADGKPEKRSPQLHLILEGDEDESVLTAGPTDLVKKLVADPPKEGDKVRIKYSQRVSLPGGKAAKKFEYEIVSSTPSEAPFLAQ